jgi:hypothetical protein
MQKPPLKLKKIFINAQFENDSCLMAHLYFCKVNNNNKVKVKLSP